MLHKLEGAGLPDVYLSSGYKVEGQGDEQTVAYAALESLYREIGRAIAARAGQMTGVELRFLRKRLRMSQAEVGALSGKTEQAVAKWEKGLTPVPIAEANIIRIVWVSRFGTRQELNEAVQRLTNHDAERAPCGYVFAFDGRNWKEDQAKASSLASESARPVLTALLERAASSLTYADTVDSAAPRIGTLRKEQEGQT